MEFIDPHQTPFVKPRSRGELPHLEKSGCTYFVTFRLLDAIVPRTGDEPSGNVDDDTTPEQLMTDYDPPLTLGSCLLREPRAARVVADALRHFDGTRYELLASCVMPNHVHAVLTPREPLEKILHSWKSFSAHEINKMFGRTGALWERESFDHLVRNVKSLKRIIRYVVLNPVIAGFVSNAADWPYSYLAGSESDVAGFARNAAETAAPQ